MKRRAKILVAVGILLALGGVVAWQWDTILRAYIFHSVRTVTTSLPRCDRTDVFYIRGNGFQSAPRGDATTGFPVHGYGTFAQILGTKSLSGGDVDKFASLWRAQTFGPEFQALCHSPAYGLRFYSGRRVVFETSLCFHCSNFCVTGLFGSGFWGFDTSSPKAEELLRDLQEIFPESIPKKK